MCWSADCKLPSQRKVNKIEHCSNTCTCMVSLKHCFHWKHSLSFHCFGSAFLLFTHVSAYNLSKVNVKSNNQNNNKREFKNFHSYFHFCVVFLLLSLHYHWIACIQFSLFQWWKTIARFGYMRWKTLNWCSPFGFRWFSLCKVTSTNNTRVI